MASKSVGWPRYCPDAPTYQEILDADTRTVPAILREEGTPQLSLEGMSVEPYVSEEYFARQIEKVWLRTWQIACREEQIPNPGDFHVFDLVGKSLIIVRTDAGEIKALYNTCLHRGRKLAAHRGCRKQFECPFHGMAWNNDGTFARNPMAWDFPQFNEQDMSLPEARLETWGGFVFVNFDKDAPPLRTLLDPIPRHFERWKPEDRYIAIHLSKRVKANWLAVAEAFMESHHSITTHPQLLTFIGDANAQHDVFSEHVTRHISSRGFTSPFVTDRVYTQDEIATAMIAGGTRIRQIIQDGDGKVPEGHTARSHLAQILRDALSKETGFDYSEITDAELGDSFVYNFFPNFSVWGGFTPSNVYIWRPDGKNHDSTIMEYMLLRQVPKDGPRPKPAPLRELGDDEPWSSVAEISVFGTVVDQDWANLPFVQEGLEASGNGLVHFGAYSEMRIRQFHRTLDAYMGRP